MGKIFREFKEFVSQGNVLDLAVAFVMGLQFTAIITSFVNNILMPLVGVIIGAQAKPGTSAAAAPASLSIFDEWVWRVRGVPIEYGKFLSTVITFLVIAFILFLIVKAANKAKTIATRVGVGEAGEVTPELTELELLTEIRDALVAKNS